MPNGFSLPSPAVLLRQPIRIGGFTDCRSTFYTAFEHKMWTRCKLPVSLCTVTILFLFALGQLPAFAQEAPQKPTEKSAAKSSEKTGSPGKAENPAQIELLDTKVRFETNGDSRKEVHALVKINSELGVRQFARLNFDFNRSFESVEIPLVHITHASGGTADILPGAITDQPNPAVVNAPAYQDVRVKSVRILGLQPGDTLEYRVIRTVSHHPLAPDFWFDHTFDRTGVVTEEDFDLDLPGSREIQMRINPATLPTSTGKSGEGDSIRNLYKWKRHSQPDPSSEETNNPEGADLVLTTYASWDQLAKKLELTLHPTTEASSAVWKKAAELAGPIQTDERKLRALYNFVSQKIVTVDLPIGVTGFRTRPPADILASGQATAEDKFALLHALASAFNVRSNAALISTLTKMSDRFPAPSVLSNCLVVAELNPPPTPGAGCGDCSDTTWLDPAIEVAPFAVLPANLRGKQALLVRDQLFWTTFLIVPQQLPYPSMQRVTVDALLSTDGTLTAKVHYTMRGDNELLLRLAFHQSLKEKWKEVAQLLSITDGFRGKVVSASTSDPYATKEPFTVEYEIEQPKFVDWSKKAVRIPALLPQLGLPDAPGKPTASAATAPIELGTPLEVETQMTLHLPAGTTAQTPTGTSVDRDYATYASQYSAKGTTLTASRHIRFLLRQIPATRAADYNAFLHAVQRDEAQDFSLECPAVPSPKPATPKDPSPTRRNP